MLADVSGLGNWSKRRAVPGWTPWGDEPATRVLAEALDALRPPWMREAACRHARDVSFFPTNWAEIEAARAVCRACAVRAHCLEFARREPLEGVWAGLTAAERAEGRTDMPDEKPLRSKPRVIARSRALNELARRHPEEFERLLADARAALEADQPVATT